MEVLFVSHKYPPTTGGMEKQSFELIRGMRKRCTTHELIYKGIGSRILFFFSLRRNIKKLLKQHPHIALIHFNDALIASFYTCTGPLPPLKHTATLHGLDVVFPSWIYHRWLLPRLNRFDTLIPVSQATARAAVQIGIEEQKIHVIKNGVDETIANYRFSQSFYDDFQRKYHLDIRDKHLLVAMGRPVKRKGFSWFLQRVTPLLSTDYILLFIGPFHWKKTKQERLLQLFPPFFRRKLELFLGAPADEKNLRELLNKPEIRKRAKHLGRLPFDEILNILHQADAFIMPNIPVKGDMEGFGLVCLEASLCGTTVFASEIDGIPDAIRSNKNGYLLPSGNAEEWGQKLNERINLKTDQKKAVNFKSYTLRHFGWKKMVKAYHHVFLSITGAAPDPHSPRDKKTKREKTE